MTPPLGSLILDIHGGTHSSLRHHSLTLLDMSSWCVLTCRSRSKLASVRPRARPRDGRLLSTESPARTCFNHFLRGSALAMFAPSDSTIGEGFDAAPTHPAGRFRGGNWAQGHERTNKTLSIFPPALAPTRPGLPCVYPRHRPDPRASYPGASCRVARLPRRIPSTGYDLPRKGGNSRRIPRSPPSCPALIIAIIATTTMKAIVTVIIITMTIIITRVARRRRRPSGGGLTDVVSA